MGADQNTSSFRLHIFPKEFQNAVPGNHVQTGCLTDERAFYAENYPQLAIERGSVDKVITMMIKGEVL